MRLTKKAPHGAFFIASNIMTVIARNEALIFLEKN